MLFVTDSQCVNTTQIQMGRAKSELVYLMLLEAQASDSQTALG